MVDHENVFPACVAANFNVHVKRHTCISTVKILRNQFILVWNKRNVKYSPVKTRSRVTQHSSSQTEDQVMRSKELGKSHVEVPVL